MFLLSLDCDLADKKWGVNCAEPCGRCNQGASCNIVDGSCADGCEDWFVNYTHCDTLIGKQARFPSAIPKYH